MDDTSGGSVSPDDPVDAVLAEYQQAAEAGRQPDREALIARYPQFARELREFFAHQEQFERTAQPFRFDPAATQGPQPGFRQPIASVGDFDGGVPPDPVVGQRVRACLRIGVQRRLAPRLARSGCYAGKTDLPTTSAVTPLASAPSMGPATAPPHLRLGLG